MTSKVLVTGSAGLVGRAVRAALTSRGVVVAELDLRGEAAAAGDVRDRDRVDEALSDCDGVVHLAAVSRVIWAEREPEACWSTNVGGLANVLAAIAGRRRPPWLVFASSREVYGQSEAFPVSESAPMRPVNLYGESKVEGERLVQAARERGLQTAIVRLSNVYGCILDHADRVVPAFARAAIAGEALRVDGADHTFDFTHSSDTVSGILRLIERLERGDDRLPPLHLLTGTPTSLGELATLAVELAGSRSAVIDAPPRSYDVAHFYGSPARAREWLGWRPEVSLREGMARLIADFRASTEARRR